VPKRLLRLPAVILVLATSGCFLFGTYPTTWEGRYRKALDELEAAQTDLGRFYAINDAAKAAFEVGKIEKAQAHAQEALGPRADGEQAPPASGPVERVVRQHAAALTERCQPLDEPIERDHDPDCGQPQHSVRDRSERNAAR
jgi:hypothetical protein